MLCRWLLFLHMNFMSFQRLFATYCGFYPNLEGKWHLLTKYSFNLWTRCFYKPFCVPMERSPCLCFENEATLCPWRFTLRLHAYVSVFVCGCRRLIFQSCAIFHNIWCSATRLNDIDWYTISIQYNDEDDIERVGEKVLVEGWYANEIK